MTNYRVCPRTRYYEREKREKQEREKQEREKREKLAEQKKKTRAAGNKAFLQMIRNIIKNPAFCNDTMQVYCTTHKRFVTKNHKIYPCPNDGRNCTCEFRTVPVQLSLL